MVEDILCPSFCGTFIMPTPAFRRDWQCPSCACNTRDEYTVRSGRGVIYMKTNECAVGEVYETASHVRARFEGIVERWDMQWGAFVEVDVPRPIRFLLGLGAPVTLARENKSSSPIVASSGTIAEPPAEINTLDEPEAPEIQNVIQSPTPSPYEQINALYPQLSQPRPAVIGADGMTIDVAGWGYPLRDLKDVIGGGPSSAGFHAVSDFLKCPEKARLSRAGVKRRSVLDGWQPHTPLDPALGIGSVIHELLAIRAVWGMPIVIDLLGFHGGAGFVPPWPLCESDRLKVYHLLMTYDHTHPREADQYLGTEVEVRTNVAPVGAPPSIRTVRYDKLFWFTDVNGGQPRIYSLEHKTSSRGGTSSMAGYGAQFAVQVALWNANPHLVAKYGKMGGVIPDVLIKTNVPSCERMPARFISPTQEKRALVYMRYVEQIVYPTAEDGSLPRMLHACWDRFRPCEYIPLCHEGLEGDYGVAGEDADEEEAA